MSTPVERVRQPSRMNGPVASKGGVLLMTLLIGDPGHGRCLTCSLDGCSAAHQPGFTIEDRCHVRYFLCSYHLLIWLRATLGPLMVAMIDD